MIFVYHKADFDGICSAAIALKYDPEAVLIGVDYPDDQAKVAISILKLKDDHEDLIVADYSFNNSIMVTLAHAFKMTWLDHHKSAIDRLRADSSFKPYVDGSVVGTAGCKLVWERLFPGPYMPITVAHIAKYDVWDHEDQYTVPFQYGLKTVEGSDDPRSDIWKLILEYSFHADRVSAETCVVGDAVINYIRNHNRRLMDKCLFYTKCLGHNIVAFNLTGVTTLDMSKENWGDADVACAFHMLSDKRWKMSLFQRPGSDVDVSSIAVLFEGGGGHRGAAGFVTKTLPIWLKGGV